MQTFLYRGQLDEFFFAFIEPAGDGGGGWWCQGGRLIQRLHRRRWHHLPHGCKLQPKVIRHFLKLAPQLRFQSERVAGNGHSDESITLPRSMPPAASCSLIAHAS